MAKSIKRAPPDVQAGAPREQLSEQREAEQRSSARAEISGEALRRQIAEAAYYRAQRRGFAPGYEQKDWVEAEAEVMTLLGLSR